MQIHNVYYIGALLAALNVVGLGGCGRTGLGSTASSDDARPGNDLRARDINQENQWRKDTAPPSPGWALALGGGGDDRGLDLALDRQGAIRVVGAVSQSGAGEQVMLARVSALGRLQWQTLAGGLYQDAAHAVAVDPAGNSLVTGVFSVAASFGPVSLKSSGKNDVFVSKVDPDGKFRWTRQLGGTTGESAQGVVTTPYAEAWVAGYFGGLLSGGPWGSVPSQGKEDVFLVRLDPPGKFGNLIRAGGASGDYAHDLAADSVGNLYVTGTFSGSATFFTPTTQVKLTSRGQQDAFVAKFDRHGRCLWAVSAGGAASDQGLAVAVSSTGDVVLSGSFWQTAHFGKHALKAAGQHDAFAARLNAAGVFIWAARLGSSGGVTGSAVALDSRGVAHVAGYFEGSLLTAGAKALPAAGSYDAFVVSLSPKGQVVRALRAGGALDDYAHSVAVGQRLRPVVTGSFKKSGDFGPNTLSAKGGADVFVWETGEVR